MTFSDCFGSTEIGIPLRMEYISTALRGYYWLLQTYFPNANCVVIQEKSIAVIGYES